MNSGYNFRIRARWRWMLFVATLSALTGYWVLQQPVRETVVSQARLPSPNSSARPAEAAPSTGTLSALPERDKIDLFAPRTWEPQLAPPVLAPTPPPAPQAPPLPFKFFGRVVDPEQPASFILTRGTEIITVRVGDRIEPSYLVDKFDGTQLHLVYLPLNIRQTIFVGNANE